jgi:hypothetical protein
VRVLGLRRAKAAVLEGSRSHPLSTLKASAYVFILPIHDDHRRSGEITLHLIVAGLG